MKQQELSHDVCKMVEDHANPYAILHAVGIEIGKAYSYTFESCSFVVGMKDMKTCHDLCFCPAGWETWEEPENPVFYNTAGIHRLVR